MLRLFKRLFTRTKPAVIPEPIMVQKPIIERQIVVSESKKATITPTITKNRSYSGGKIDVVIRTLIRRINKLHNKQKKHGLSQKEIVLLAESQKYLEKVTATREGTKKIFVED